MDFVVENGTGMSDATSYVDLQYAQDYFTRKNMRDWWDNLNSDAQKNELINGTEYADKKFGPKLDGKPLNPNQALEFPRSGLKDRYGRPITGVPKNVKDATCEYAWLSSNGQLHATSQQVNAKVESKTTKVGPITTSVKYVDSVTKMTYLEHPYPDSLINFYVDPMYGSFGSAKVIRG